MQTGNSSMRFNGRCFDLGWIGTDLVRCYDVSDLKFRTSKHADSKLGNSHWSGPVYWCKRFGPDKVTPKKSYSENSPPKWWKEKNFDRWSKTPDVFWWPISQHLVLRQCKTPLKAVFCWTWTVVIFPAAPGGTFVCIVWCVCLREKEPTSLSVRFFWENSVNRGWLRTRDECVPAAQLVVAAVVFCSVGFDGNLSERRTLEDWRPSSEAGSFFLS